MPSSIWRSSNDVTVKETRGIIVQFSYGEDGVDASKRDYASPENVHRIVQRVLGRAGR